MDLIRALPDYPFLHVTGIHYFTGTQKRQVKTVEKELLKIDAFLEKVKEETGHENRPFAVVFGPFYGGQTKGVQQKSHPFGWLWS